MQRPSMLFQPELCARLSHEQSVDAGHCDARSRSRNFKRGEEPTQHHVARLVAYSGKESWIGSRM